MNIEKQNDLLMQAAGTVFGSMLQRMVSDPLEFEPLTGEVTMTPDERQRSIDEGIDEMLDGSMKVWSGALGEQLVRKGTRRGSTSRKRQVRGRSHRSLNTNSIIQLD